jgi:hypothetical protein
MDQRRTMRRVGGWCITLGIITLTVGVTVGIGTIIAGGDLLKHS